MKISDVLQEKGNKVYTVQAEQQLTEALKMMVRHRIGSLLVMDREDEIAGLVSERDILLHIDSAGGVPGTTLVKEVMTPRQKLIVVAENDDLDYAMSVMTNNRIRHLPVVGGGKLCGLVSIGDLIKTQLSFREHENKMLQDYITGRYPG